jgi:hypothetical protein
MGRTFADSHLIEFKEIRKEWKAKKKEEESQRKADEERQRQTEGRSVEQHDQNAPYGQMRTTLGPPPNIGGPQLPPIGYPPQQGGPPSQPQYGQPQPSPGMDMGQYASTNNLAYNNGNNLQTSYPQSPYAPNNQVYQQRCQSALVS